MDRLVEIYKQIPKMKCAFGCADCCGPVMWMKMEWKRCPLHREQTTINCPYAGKMGGCEVYEYRPFICRLFGTTDALPCPRGCRPEGKMLTREEAHALTVQFLKITKEEEDG